MESDVDVNILRIGTLLTTLGSGCLRSFIRTDRISIDIDIVKFYDSLLLVFALFRYRSLFLMSDTLRKNTFKVDFPLLSLGVPLSPWNSISLTLLDGIFLYASPWDLLLLMVLDYLVC
jgi:hypothetical protein